MLKLTGLALTGLTAIIVVIMILIGGPIAAIWAVNTLFGLHIALTLETWLAALFLMAIVGGSRS